MITEAQVKEFQKIYKRAFGKNISKTDACSQGISLVNLIELINNNLKLKNNPNGQENGANKKSL